MQDLVNARGLQLLAETNLSYDPHKGMFRYRVRTDHDVNERRGNTSVYFDGDSGAFRGYYLPTGVASGDTVTQWILTLHMAAIWGIPFRIFVTLIGLVVALLSITGVYIWWKKHKGRSKFKQQQGC